MVQKEGVPGYDNALAVSTQPVFFWKKPFFPEQPPLLVDRLRPNQRCRGQTQMAAPGWISLITAKLPLFLADLIFRLERPSVTPAAEHSG